MLLKVGARGLKLPKFGAIVAAPAQAAGSSTPSTPMKPALRRCRTFERMPNLAPRAYHGRIKAAIPRPSFGRRREGDDLVLLHPAYDSIQFLLGQARVSDADAV